MKKPKTSWGVGTAGVFLVERWSILGALDGNPKRLAMRLRAGEASRAEMAFAADLIERKVKPRRRRSSQPSRIENELIAEFVYYLQGIHPDWQRKKVISKIAEMFGVQQRHVYNVLEGLDPEHRKHIGDIVIGNVGWDEELMRYVVNNIARKG
jgi:hypothetical protein